MMPNKVVLNEVMKDTADAIREKKGTSDLIAPVNFAEEIKGITSGGGGGADLEGEYFLAKPNGRYWKSKFFEFERANVPCFDISKVTEEQIENIHLYIMIMAYCGYSAIGYNYGLPTSAYDTTSFSPVETACRCGGLAVALEISGPSRNIPPVFEECNSKILNMEVDGVVGFMRSMMDGELDDLTDDEVLAFASDFLMMEQITKEEYDEWKYWNIN